MLTERLVLFTTLVMSIAGGLATSIIAPSLPSIAKDFVTGESYTQLSVSLFLIALGVSPLVFGPLSDSLGRKPRFYIGFSLILSGALLTAFSSNINAFIFGRIIQGAGCVSIAVTTRAIIRDTLNDGSFSQGLSWLILGTAIPPLLASIIGAYFQEAYGWRSVIYFYIVIVFISFFIVMCILPATNKLRGKLQIKAILETYLNLAKNFSFLASLFLTCIANLFQIFYLMATPFIFEKEFRWSTADYGKAILAILLFEMVGVYLAGLVMTPMSCNDVFQDKLRSIFHALQPNASNTLFSSPVA